MARRHRYVRVMVATMVAGMLFQVAGAPIAAAIADITDEIKIDVTRQGDRASIVASRVQVTTNAGSGASNAGGTSQPSQQRGVSKNRTYVQRAPEPICTNEIEGLDFLLATPPPPEMQDPYLVNEVCKLNGVLVNGGGVFWRDRATVAAAAAAGALAPAPIPAITDVDIRRYVEDFLVPELVIRHNPEGASLTGIETWFWVEGWDGEPVIETVDVLGFPVLVELYLASVEWDFGDGSRSTTTDLGHAYPEAAGTTHVYTERSTASGANAAFTASSTVTIEVEVSIGGGPLVPLQPFSQTETAPIIVREAQALLE